MLSRIDWQIVADVSKDCITSVFRVKQSKKHPVSLADPGDVDPTFSQNVSKYFPVDRAQSSRRTESSATSLQEIQI